MRIVVDLQGAQTESRFRGIGRYSLSLTQALARNAGNHELWIALNSRFEDTIEQLRAAFDGLVPQDRIVSFDIPGPVAEIDSANVWRARAAEYVREQFLAMLQPDFTFVTSLFEGFLDDASTSVGLLPSVGLSAVTVYDLIPLLATSSHLTNERIPSWYYRKLDSLKRADMMLAISEATRQEIITILSIPEESVVNVSSAADGRFRQLELNPDCVQRTRSTFGVLRPFVMHSGGFDHHKNLERLVEGFSLLPASLRKQYQLVITGKAPFGEIERLSRISNKNGLSGDSVVFAGYVNDDDLVVLYNLCDLFVCPSLHEGFGLPALEAMACGAPVIGSNTTSIPEVLGRDDALFNPTDPRSIAEKMTQILTDSTLAQSLREHGLEQSKKFSWEESARRVMEAFEQNFAHRQCVDRISHGVLRSRPRLAYLSPLPPERSGIADYSAELLPELSRYYEIEVVVDQAEVSDPWICANFHVRSPQWFDQNGERYDRIVYHIGNSPFHLYQLDLLERHPGTVVLHDFFLSSVFEYSEREHIVPGAFRKALYASNGYAGLVGAQENSVDAKYNFPANKQVLDLAAGVIVHSQVSKQWAADCYGAEYSQEWRIIPALRALQPMRDRASARDKLSVGRKDFIVCSLGFVDPTKLCHKLIDAWLESSLAKDPRCRLFLVGANHGGDYGARLLRRIASAGEAKDRIQITGWTSTELFQTYLLAADAAVQLRTSSRGETSRAVLDCLASGIPTIVNAHGTAVELPDDVLIKLRDRFDNDELSAELERLWHDEDYRARLSSKAIDHVRTVHAPARVAEMYRDAIEYFAKTALIERERKCYIKIAQLSGSRKPSEDDFFLTATALARNKKPRGLAQVIVDVTSIAKNDLKTGIERVVRSILLELLVSSPREFRIEPAYFDGHRYRYARNFTLKFLALDTTWIQDEVLTCYNGDVFLGLDWSADTVPLAEGQIREMRDRGVRIAFIVHDLLPVTLPQHFPEGIGSMVSVWLDVLARLSDVLVCVSCATADDLLRWLEENQPSRYRPLAIGISHNGADVAASAPTMGLPASAESVFRQCGVRPSFLMVGTVEPRKGHSQAIAAFEKLWGQGIQANLVIVGKQGWMVEYLVEKLRSHPEAGRRLHFLEWVSDEMLLKLYNACSALLMTSEGEGFGLPLIEAARHKLPIIARDIPVFREVAGNHAYYFSGTEADKLADAISDWIQLKDCGNYPDSSQISWLTWKESTAHLLKVILGGEWDSLWPATQSDTGPRFGATAHSVVEKFESCEGD